MKKYFLFSVLLLNAFTGFSQSTATSQNKSTSELKPDLGIIIYSNDAETVWNAYRLANFSAAKGDIVAVFLLGKGVEAMTIKDEKFNVKEQFEDFIAKNGKVLACGTCIKIRNDSELNQCPISNLSTLYDIIMNSKKTITF